jgi:hypothetical protein
VFCGAEGRVGHDKIQELANTERMDTVRVRHIISVALSPGQGRIFNLVNKRWTFDLGVDVLARIPITINHISISCSAPH